MIIIIKILDIIFIIVLRVSLLLMIWSSVNIVFYLFRYIIIFCCLRRVSYNTSRTYEWCAQIMQDLHYSFTRDPLRDT